MILKKHWFPCAVLFLCVVSASQSPLSHRIKLHKVYTSRPPHDSSLYEVLQVSPNATSADIQKSYRKLSRVWHPDKHRRRRSNDRHESAHLEHSEECEQQLKVIREAYEVLKDDATRLLYHRYGLRDTKRAVLILTGFQSTQKHPTRDEVELLKWMGYNSAPPPARQRSFSLPLETTPTTSSSQWTHRQRVNFLAATILEVIRPLVEGVIDDRTLANVVAQQCDRLKKLPLGAQILRCVGRAYRHAGRKLLRRELGRSVGATPPFPDPVHDTIQDAKHLWTAAIASGRLALREQWLLTQSKILPQKPRNNNGLSIAYHFEGDLGGVVDEDGRLVMDDGSFQEDLPSEEVMEAEEKHKVNHAVTETLQVEALWKVYKIGLNRAIRDASELILGGQYFYFFQRRGGDGWVGPSGQVIDARTGRLRTAAALALVGDIMVRSSKEDTAWIE